MYKNVRSASARRYTSRETCRLHGANVTRNMFTQRLITSAWILIDEKRRRRELIDSAVIGVNLVDSTAISSELTLELLKRRVIGFDTHRCRIEEICSNYGTVD